MFLRICEDLEFDGEYCRALLKVSEYPIQRSPELNNNNLSEYLVIEAINQISCRLTALILRTSKLVVPAQLREVHFYKAFDQDNRYFLLARFIQDKVYNKVFVSVVDEHQQKYVEGTVLTSLL